MLVNSCSGVDYKYCIEITNVVAEFTEEEVADVKMLCQMLVSSIWSCKRLVAVIKPLIFI